MKQKNLITVVTDHQLTADTIARAIGANEKHDGYYLGNGYAVTWTNGRVIEATFSPCESFVLSTTMDCRLVYAHNFKFAMRDYDSLVGYKKSEQDRKQLATIKVLWAISDIVVNAMIPDITGDLDFLSLYYYLAMPVDVRRAWLPILTKGAIRHGVSHGPSDRREYEAWLEESIYNLLVKATQESLPLEGAPVVEEIPTEEAARLSVWSLPRMETTEWRTNMWLSSPTTRLYTTSAACWWLPPPSWTSTMRKPCRPPTPSTPRNSSPIRWCFRTPFPPGCGGSCSATRRYCATTANGARPYRRVNPPAATTSAWERIPITATALSPPGYIPPT